MYGYLYDLDGKYQNNKIWKKANKRLQEANFYKKMKMHTPSKFGNQNSEGSSSKFRFNFFKIDTSCLGPCTTMQRECTFTVYNFRDVANPTRANAILSRADGNSSGVLLQGLAYLRKNQLSKLERFTSFKFCTNVTINSLV